MSLRQYLKNKSSDQSASNQRALRGAAECMEALQTQQDELKQKGCKRTASLLLQYYNQRVQLCKLASMAKAVALVSTRKNRKEASS